MLGFSKVNTIFAGSPLEKKQRVINMVKIKVRFQVKFYKILKNIPDNF
jgi:hypothetical protein